MTFHEKLYGLRKKAGMTQLELAEKLNVSRQAVSRWEMGTAKPEADTLIAICDLFDVSLDFLLRDKAQEKRGDPEELLPPVPKYWDHLPKLWFVPAVFAVLCRIFPYFTEMALMFHFPFWETLETFVLEHKLLLIFFSPPVAYLASSIFGALTALCFVWALYKFLKARN